MRWFCAVVVVVVGVAVLPSQAHVVIPAEFREVATEATLIVRGRVTDVRSVVEPGNGIESIAAVAVESVLKGQAGGFVYVRVPGGEVGRSKVVMVGAPTFRVGQRAVFFLKPNATDSSFRPIGLTLGVYRVQAEPGTGRPVIAPPVVAGRTAPLFGPTTRGDTRRKLMPVRDFEALVRVVLAAPSGRATPRGGGQ